MPKILSSHSHWGPQNSGKGWRGRERKKKGNKVATELPREATPIAEEELEIKERWGGGGGGGC